MSHTDSVIERYAAGGPLLVYATSGLTHEHETERVGPGTWSISELVAHLLDSDLVLADRMKRVIAEDEPALLAFDENRWIERLDSRSMPVEEAVSLLAGQRHWMTRILRKCTEADFNRAGIHSEAGRKTLADLVVSAVSHVDHHLRFLFAKRATLGVAVIPHYSDDAPAGAGAGL
jgi:uncharacterized damage-inducible protein DinB